MDLFNKEQLKELAEIRNDLCVSIYMPTVRVESDVAQNPIRLKNMLREARQHLKEAGQGETTIESLLEPIQARLEDSPFWMYQSDGLAIFATPEDVQFLRLPIDFEELVVVGNRFHLKPLFPLIATNNLFYLLALSANNVRLFQGTHYSISEVHTSDIPSSITDALFADDPEKQLQFHTANRVGKDRRDNVFHGQGRQNDDVRSRPQDRLRRFFREVDNGLVETLKEEQAPLLLAGVDYYLPIYRDANSYAHLIADEIVSGNPDHLSQHDLHGRAWPVMEKYFLRNQTEALERFYETAGNHGELTSTDMEDVVAASMYSRIDTLFVPVGEHQWGTFDPDTSTVELHEEYTNGGEDLLDLAAVSTYLNGGTVHALQREHMPNGAQVAATFRFAMKETA